MSNTGVRKAKRKRPPGADFTADPRPVACTAKPHVCGDCRAEIHQGERATIRVWVAAGSFDWDWTCFVCL